MSESIQALHAFSTSMQVTANNLANMNTDEYHARRVELETGPQDRGVRVQGISENTQPGAQVSRLADAHDNGNMEQTMTETSNVDVAEEMTQMMLDQHAFEANAHALVAQERLIGQFINEMV